ncbi:TPA: zinc ribbon domain-containing protein [Pseudomonas aeruginosa]|uniref:zinc ribbon domain-containing protein n=1 Tax=Pseudomonas aeruginosa TaxID=287 RepID=UPI002159FDA8|nr:zinc ribbon domain-containing protein [Pseudomonas aeruginosa]
MPTQPAHTLKTCPYCAEQVQRQAVFCKHCGNNIRDTIDHHPMKDQWDNALEKLPTSKSHRWGSSPQPINEQNRH